MFLFCSRIRSWLWGSTPDLYRIVSELVQRGVAFKVVDDPSIDTSTRTGKLIMGILASLPNLRTTFVVNGNRTASTRLKPTT